MNIEDIKRLCPEFCLLIEEWSGGRNIPAFLVVKALAEARQALEWRPIDNVQLKFGDPVLVTDGFNQRVATLQLDEFPDVPIEFWALAGGGDLDIQPKRFRYLTTPPSVKEG